MEQSEFERTPKYYARQVFSNLRIHGRRLLPVQVRPRSVIQKWEQTPHWVVCFYGVDRSLKYTAYSILRHIFRPLQRARVRVTVVAHFNQISKIAQGNSKEGNVDFTHDRIHLLNADVLWVEPQSDESIRHELQILEGVNWPISTPVFANAKWNLMHQLHSLDRVNTLVHTAGLGNADVFALLRADMQFLDDLDVEAIQRRILSDNIDVITPDWQKWGGLNDRFSFLSRRSIEAIATRRRLVESFAKQHNVIHAERLLLHAAQQGNLNTDFTRMRAERVRGNGHVWFEPFSPQ
jgi:hypothetical protein